MRSIMMLHTYIFLLLAVSSVSAKGGGTAIGGTAGTAKPPVGVAPAAIPPQLPAFVSPRSLPVTGPPPSPVYQFDMTGIIQAVSPGSEKTSGGNITINNISITVSANTIVQFPANTLSWHDAVTSGQGAGILMRCEAHVIGNIVDSDATAPKYIAGLIYISQESLNSGQGFISNIDYTTGNIAVSASFNGPALATLQINDPNGRFGKAQSPDPRFSVDDANPTITSSTGYPMCVPRTDPTSTPTDPLCPPKNRPKLNDVYGCKTFTQAGVTVLPTKTGDLKPGTTPGTNVCNMFVMPPLPPYTHSGVPTKPAAASPPATVGPGTPDPRQMAPLMVGDYVTWQGTLGLIPGGVTSVHTIEANVGIYTFPGTFPAYIKNGDSAFASGDNGATSANGIAQETRDRFFLTTSVTDYYTPIDIYLVDYAVPGDTLTLPRGMAPPPPGTEVHRWITPFEVTGEQNGPAVAAASAVPVGGGINTAMTGVLISRDRIRATKAPTGFITIPTRNVRTVYRSLCLPPSEYLSGTSTSTTFNHVFTLPGVLGVAIDIPAPISTPTDTCVKSAVNKMDNGLYVGQYLAPIFSYIFPENIFRGDAIVPNNMWNLAFLVNGEGGGGGLSVAGLSPQPY